jgi:hypothetical protein
MMKTDLERALLKLEEAYKDGKMMHFTIKEAAAMFHFFDGIRLVKQNQGVGT